MNNLGKFYSVAQQGGFSKDYLGKVTLMDFSHLGPSDVFVLKENNLLYIKDFTLPGIKVEEASVKMQGNIIKDIGNIIYNEKNINITFYTDQFYGIRKYFELIIKNQSLNSNLIAQNMNNTNIVLSILLEDGVTEAFKFNIKGAMLLGIEQVTYNTAGPGNIQELKLNFSFGTYETESSRFINPSTNEQYSYSARNPVQAAAADTGIRVRAADLSRDRTSILGGIIQGLNNLGQVARAFGGAAGAIGGAAGSVGRATTEVRSTGRVIRNR